MYTDGEFRGRRMYARLSRVDSISDPRRSRTYSYEFDAIEVGFRFWPDRNFLKRTHYDEFALLRIEASKERLRRTFGFVPAPGQWCMLETSPAVSSGRVLPCLQAQRTQTGYSELSSGFLHDIRSLEPEEGGPKMPKAPLSAGVVPREALPDLLRKMGDILLVRRSGRKSIERLLQQIDRPTQVIVRDVGQASFSELIDAKKRTSAFFDVGTPTAFNKRTVPAGFLPRRVNASDSACVIISHFDMDHFHAALQNPDLQKLHWIVPQQKLGPGASEIVAQMILNKRLHIFDGRAISFPGGTLDRAAGRSGRNETGLVLRAALQSDRSVLLCGDASYSNIPRAMKAGVDRLVASHHGSKTSGNPPRAPAGGTCIVSCGRRNAYGHPHAAARKAHRLQGWGDMQETCATRHGRRGDRIIS